MDYRLQLIKRDGGNIDFHYFFVNNLAFCPLKYPLPLINGNICLKGFTQHV